MQEMYLGPRFKDIKTSKDINNVKSLANNSGLLEKEMATHSGILDWEIPWQRSLVVCSLWGHKRIRHDLAWQQQQ